MNNNQIVSKKRVAEHGEVFTNPREVNAMLDLVKQETERIDSRFLEPACGKGAFLTEILKRKLEAVAKRYKKNITEYEKYAILAISSIYGIDILEDNVANCREIMLNIFKSEYKTTLKQDCLLKYENTIRFLLNKNIIWGDALTLKRVDKPEEPIVFSEWSIVNENMIKRRDFSFRQMLNQSVEGLPLFSDIGEDVWLPKPIKEFPLIHYLELENAEKL